MVQKVVNSALFSQNLHEIVWKIQKHEGMFVEFDVDAAFVGANISHPLHITKPVHRLIFSREDIPQQYDFMYSEMSMLKM